MSPFKKSHPKGKHPNTFGAKYSEESFRKLTANKTNKEAVIQKLQYEKKKELEEEQKHTQKRSSSKK